MIRKYNKELFLEVANKKYNFKYDYSLVGDINGSKNRVKIICPIHGEFEQTVDKHLRKEGTGCPKCGREKANLSNMTNCMFFEEAKNKHGDKYDYSKFKYVGGDKKGIIICPTHGEQLISPKRHLKTKGCPECNKNKTYYKKIECIQDLRIEIESYGYILISDYYENTNTPLVLSCKNHGEFNITLTRLRSGNKCPKCSAENRVKTRKSRASSYILQELKEKFEGKYDFSNSVFLGSKEKMKVICLEHGEFIITPDNLRCSKIGCPQCVNEYSSKNQVSNTCEFILKAKEKHNNKYDYSKSKYINAKTNVEIACHIHGSFFQTPNNHLKGENCPTCSVGTSKFEEEIAEFVQQYVSIERNKRIIPGLELDILIPSLKIGIEADGLYWHSDANIGRLKHINKTNEYSKIGYRVIHIFEDEWSNKREIVESRLKNILGVTKLKIPGRKTTVQKIEQSTSDFLNNNHIQGNTTGKNMVAYGLYYNEELVSVMTFCKPRNSIGPSSYGQNNVWELLRFCNKLDTTVIGGASKLLKKFLQDFGKVKIYTYADRRWSVGNLYEKLGFTFAENTSIGYFYTKGTKRYNRIGFQKAKLVEMGHDPNKSEREIMTELGYNRIYDCGNAKYVMINF